MKQKYGIIWNQNPKKTKTIIKNYLIPYLSPNIAFKSSRKRSDLGPIGATFNKRESHEITDISWLF
jgi:hypothetical protein